MLLDKNNPRTWDSFYPTSIIAHDVARSLDHATAIVGGPSCFKPTYVGITEFNELPQGLYGNALADEIVKIDARHAHDSIILVDVNAPLPERRWLRVTARSRIGPPFGGPARPKGRRPEPVARSTASRRLRAPANAVRPDDTTSGPCPTGKGTAVPVADPGRLKGVGFADPLSGTLSNDPTYGEILYRQIGPRLVGVQITRSGDGLEAHMRRAGSGGFPVYNVGRTELFDRLRNDFGEQTVRLVAGPDAEHAYAQLMQLQVENRETGKVYICPPGQHDDLAIACAMLNWYARHPHLPYMVRRIAQEKSRAVLHDDYDFKSFV